MCKPKVERGGAPQASLCLFIKSEVMKTNTLSVKYLNLFLTVDLDMELIYWFIRCTYF